MKKILALLLTSVVLITSCKNDDDTPDVTPPRDRGEEALAAQIEIEAFLETHFYNYEDFQNPPADFDYKIKIDSIAGDNIDKIPLIMQVNDTTVTDRIDEDVTYTLYYLNARQGGGETPNFPDIAILNYEGISLDLETFDSAVTPVGFDLTSIVDGLQAALIQFNTAETRTDNPDGTTTFENYGVGAVFIPSGLGYFNLPPSDIPLYEQLIFTFQLFDSFLGDQDNDSVLSITEDINGNGIEEDDDTDEDGIPNYADDDDDNDGKLTIDEIKDLNGNIITDPALYPDVDGDGTPDYLDSDS